MVGLPLSTWISAGLTFLAVALGTLSLAMLLEWMQERRRRREMMRQLGSFDGGKQDSASGLFKRAVEAQPVWVQAMMAKTPAFTDLTLMMQQGGVTMGVDTYFILTAGGALGFGLFTFALTQWLFAATLGSLVGAFLPYVYVRQKRKVRLNRFESNLPEAIDLLGRAIRAGHPLSSGFKMVADETADPIAEEFRRTFEEQRFGIPFDDAILAMADRVTLVDVRILVTAILIQREVGGNLAEVLDNLASVIRARFTIRRQLRTYTAQGRISGYVLAALPIVVGTVIYFLNPEYERLLVSHPIGKFMLGTAVVMQILGYLWIRKIVDIDI